MKKEFSQEIQEETNDKSVPSPNISSELVGISSKKDVLADELVRLFEKLLSGEQERNDKHLDSCTSDSEQSEVETLSGQDPPSDDEGPIKKDNSEEKDASSTNTSPRPTGQKTTGELEDQREDKVDPSVPVIFKLPSRIENVLNIERFNMSRLLRNEYIDRIQRSREKLRRAKAKKEDKNGELASKFQEEVKALLEGVEFGESGEEERTLPQRRRRLTATPSYDSGIVDPTEQDKDEVVKKYKELLEKARRDLNRAHRALKARSSGGQEMKDEIAAMKRSAKEAKNDLDELEEKRNDLDVERDRLLGKVKDFKASTSFDDEEKMSDSGDISMLEREDRMPLEGDPSEGVFANQVSADENNIAERSSERSPGESETVEKDLERKMKDMENKIEKLREEKMSVEEEVKELQSKLVAGTGGEEILKDLQEKLTAANDQKSKLEDKCSELEREMLMKDNTFGAEIKKKEAEVNELQKKLVSGSGGEDILKELQEKLDNVHDEKLTIEEKCVGLEEKVNEKEEKLKSIEDEMDALERKSVEGTGAEEIVVKLQQKLNNAKAENAKEEEKCHELEKDVQEKNKALKDLKESHEKEIDELQKQLVAGTGGEKVLEDLKEQLREETKQNGGLEEKNSELEKEMKRKEAAFSDKEKKLEDEKNELQRKLVEGTGGEEILTELQKKLKEAKKQNNILKESNSDLEKQIERKERTFSEAIKKLEDEINDLQDKLVSGTGGEEILYDLQDKLNEAEKKNNCFEKKNSDLEKEIENKEKKMKDEINDLQRKLVAGSGGEEILEGLQEKLRQEKDEKVTLQRKCKELEDKAKAKDEELGDEIKQKDNEINELQKKLTSGIGGDEILAELQDKLEHEKDKKVSLQTRCEELEDQRKAKDKEFSDEIKEKDNEINELQKKIVSGTGAEDILAELQDELEKAKQDKAVLQTHCEEQEDKLKTKNREFNDEIKQKDHEISEMQKKLVSGTGGEEILAELQDKLLKEKDDKVALQTRCQELENQKKEKDKDFSNEIKQKDNEINELQKKLLCGTGGEEILAELQDKLVKANEEKVALQTQCDELKKKKKEKDKELGDEIKEKDYEINELQKKLVSGTGGEEILTDLQGKLEKAKEEIAVLQTQCQELEGKKREKDKEFSDEIKTKDNEIGELQKLVNGTGGEEILAELQDKLEKAKEDKAVLQTQCEELEEKRKRKDKELSDEIEQKDNEINELQKKLVSGTGGEEILAELQDKLEKAKEDKAVLQTQCEELEEKRKRKDKELSDEIKQKDNEINELQKKLVSGTGGEEILAELQDKLEKAKDEKAVLQTRCEEFEDKAKIKDKESTDKIKEKNKEINELHKKFVSGTGGEEILAELQDKLEKAKNEKITLQTQCEELEDEKRERDEEFSDEIKKKENEINELQKKLVSGTGGEEILSELRDKLEKTKDEKAVLQTRCEEFEDKAKKKDKELCTEIKEKDHEINELQKKLVSGTGGEELLGELQNKVDKEKEEKADLQRELKAQEDKLKAKDQEFKDQIEEKAKEIDKLHKKLASGTGGEEILAELQDKLEKAKDEKVALQTICEELEEQKKVNDKESNDKIQEKDKEINELQKKLVSGTGGEEILAELQDKLEKAKDEKVALQTICEELEEQKKVNNKESSDKIQEKDKEINELQKKLVSGTGGEEILAELQNKLEKAKDEKVALQTICEELEEQKKANNKESNDKIQEKDKEINELQKRLASGTGGEELVAELLDKLEKEKDKNVDLQRRCEQLEDKAKIKDKENSDEIKEKDEEINELQKNLVRGTGGEEILAQLQNKLEKANEEKAVLQIECEKLKEKRKEKDKEFSDEIKEKDDEIDELQKKLVSGTGGEEILTELQDKLRKEKDEKVALKTRCEELEDQKKEKDEELSDTIKGKDNKITELQKKLVSGTGGEEILEELQIELEKSKEEKAVLQAQFDQQQDKLKTNDKNFNDKIGEKDSEINELQKKLVTGTGGEEILAELQDKLVNQKDEKVALQTRCEDLEEEIALKDTELRNQQKENTQKVNDLQTKLIAGTGSEEVLAELQNKLKKAEESKEILAEKCCKLEEKVKKKDLEAKTEKNKKDEEIDKLQRRLLGGTAGEEILEELKVNLKEAEEEKEKLERTCTELEEDLETKEKELQEKDEEVIDLQKKIIDGSGGEELLKKLQENLKDAKESEKILEKRCSGLEKDLQEKERKLTDESKRKQNEIEDLQRKLVNGSGGEEVLLDLQDKLNQSDKDKVMLESKVAELQKDMEGMSDKFADKQEEVNQLQRDLVEGTEAEDILVDLQEKLATAKNDNKKLETKCSELEKQRKQRNLDGDNKKELKNLKAANKVLENESKAKQEKINELQLKMLEGRGGEDVLKELQNELNAANERNKELVIRNKELEEERSEDLENNIAALMEENGQLEEDNEAMATKLENLQKSVVNGTGGEELLQELQDEIKKLSSENQDLRKVSRGKESISLEGKDSQQLEKELKKVNQEKGRLIADNERKENEIADLQRKLVAGSGGEELLADLQEEIKRLNDENKKMIVQLDDLKEMTKDLTDETKKKKKLEKGLLKENEKLFEQNESKDSEIRKLQKSIAEGGGADELVKMLQDKVKETADNNRILEKKCSDLECDAVGLLDDKDLLKQKAIDLDEAEKKIERLAQDCEEKDQEIVELQRKLVAGTGGEKVLEDLQNQVKNLQELNKDLGKKLSKSRKDRTAQDSLEKRGNKFDKKTPNNLGPQKTDKSTGNRFTTKVEGKDASYAHNADEYADEDIIDEPITYEQCLQKISEANDEKDFWKEKYEALKRKVGEQFVDTIPDVWKEETELEKQREEILSQLSDLRQEISERETPVIKTVSEKERIETELSKVENDLEVCSENLEQFRDMQNEEKLIGRNEEKLAQCLHELGLKTESLPEKYSEGVEDSKALMIPDDNDTEELERKFEQLYSEAAALLAEEQDLRESQDKEKDIAVEKIDTENEIQQIEAAIQKLQQGLARESDSSSRNLEGLKNQHSKTEDLTNELAKVQHEINELQSSLEAPSSSSGQEVNNLLALMKEKSKLEDELTDTEKSVNQLGKREYEALIKERQRHEKVAKTLLELTREKEATEEELQGIEALVQEKESELLKSFNAELKDKEALDTPKKKGRRFRKRKSSFEVKSEEPGAASSAEEGFSDIDLGDPPLSSDATLALSEELGSLIQKKSSLAVRVEELGKKITAQSLKVEKSLLGVKDDASGDQPFGESFVSVEDLTQSQMSIFDDYNMVDELSLATSIVGDERVKRKSSRKGPMSKLLKEKSALEKKLKESQGKVLVQNTKVKNTLKEDKDAGKAKEKFLQAVQDRKVVEDELSNVGRKIDELASEEGSVKGKKAKTPKKGKSLSKNDKRRLLSQRESLGKQLDAIKKKIENFSLDGEDAGLADFPEMRETGSIGNTVERLRELIAREAKLKQELNRLTAKEDTDSVSSRLGGRKTPGEMLNKRGKVGRRGDRKGDIEGSSMTSEFSGNTSEFSGITSEGSGVTSEASGMTSDSSVTDEGTGVILDTDEELVKSHDKDGLVKDTVDTSHTGQLNRDLGNQVKGLSSGDEDYQSDDGMTKRETEVKSGKNIHDRGVSLGEVDSKVEKNTSGLLQLPDSKDTKESSIQGDKVPTGSPSYPEVIDLLVKEKARKAARLRDIEKKIENMESGADKTQDADLLLQMKRENLQHKMQLALNELQQRKEALEESKNLLRETTTDEDPEKILERDHFALTKQKDELGAELTAIKNEMDKQARRGEDLEGISTGYQTYKDVKEKEKDLVEELDEINEKLHKRKEWSALDSPREEVNNELAETYADILKRMSEENLNMADLIHELEETKATLSKEREITSELLDLIKSRVGNELLEALMGQGLQSPSAEIREMGMFEGEGYQELVDKVENETVTVAEVIDEYKKINQFLFGENQKLHKTMELLKAKVDEDLFATIVDQESADVEISKKNEISEILANNKTLFEQISSASENEKLVRNMEDEIQNLKRELEGVKKRDEKDKVMKEKVEDISKELGEAKKRREELKQKLKNLERDVGFSNKAFDKSAEEHRYSEAETDSQLKEFNESQNQADLTKEIDGSIEDKRKLKEMGAPKDLTEEDGESGQIDRDEVLQEIKSRLEEAAELGNRADVELAILIKKLAGTETEISGSGIQQQEAMKGSDGRSELKDNENQDLGSGGSGKHKQDDGQTYEYNRGYAEENTGDEWSENISSVQNLERAFVAKLDEVQDLQENLKKHLDKKELAYVAKQEGIQLENNVLREELEKNKSALHNLKKEHEALRSDLEKVEDINEGLRNDLELSKETFDENKDLKVTRQSMEDEIEETTAKLRDAGKERDEIRREFENLQKENKSVEDRLGSAENENNELKEKIAALQNENEELTNNLNECQKTVDQAKEMLSTLEEANALMKEKNDKSQHENEELKTNLTEANEMKKETEKVLGDLEAKTTSLQEKIATLENEKLDTNEIIRVLKNENEEGIVKLNEINETLKDNKEKFKTLQDLDGKNESLEKALNVLEKENKELNGKIIGLQNENEEVTAKLNEAREMIKDNEELVKTLHSLGTENKSLKEALDSLQIENKKMKDKTQEHESIKNTLALLENENNEIIPRVEELEKLKKELEDEVEYLRKEDKDFQSLNEKLKNAEVKQENMEKELEVLKKESKEIEDFVREDLNQDTENGVKSALETFKEMCEKNDAENKSLKEEAKKLTKLQNIVGDNLSKKLIDLSKEGLVLDDSEDNPKCLESLINDNKSLASILNQYESELAKVEQHLGDDLLSIVTNRDSELDEEESENPLKIVDELKNGKNLKEIIKEYEDLINSQADNDQNVQYLQEKVDMLESKLETLKNIRDNVLVEDDASGRVMANVEDQNEPDIASAGKYGDVKCSEAALLQGTI